MKSLEVVEGDEFCLGKLYGSLKAKNTPSLYYKEDFMRGKAPSRKGGF